LPKGPVRFLGVTPNEDNEDKPLIRNRGRPQRVQEPAPVEEIVDDSPQTSRRRLSTTTSTEVIILIINILYFKINCFMLKK